MKVILHKWANVIDYIGTDKIMLKAFLNFYKQINSCSWKTPSDVLRSFNTADIVYCKKAESNRIVFNIGGNKYRMVCGYRFGTRSIVLYIKFVGVHSDYDKIDVCKVNLFKS